MRNLLKIMMNASLLGIVFFLVSCASTPRCNLEIINSMKKKNIYLPNKNANGLDDYLKNSSDWIAIPKKNGKLNHKAIYKLTAKKFPALCVYNSGSANEMGHIVEISRKKKFKWSSSFNNRLPFVWGSLNGRRAKTSLLSKHFSPSKEPKMNYYVYIGD